MVKSNVHVVVGLVNPCTKLCPEHQVTSPEAVSGFLSVPRRADATAGIHAPFYARTSASVNFTVGNRQFGAVRPNGCVAWTNGNPTRNQKEGAILNLTVAGDLFFNSRPYYEVLHRLSYFWQDAYCLRSGRSRSCAWMQAQRVPRCSLAEKNCLGKPRSHHTCKRKANLLVRCLQVRLQGGLSIVL